VSGSDGTPGLLLAPHMALVEECDVFFARQPWQAIRHQLEVELGERTQQPSNSTHQKSKMKTRITK
jgi:hypothetical protein